VTDPQPDGDRSRLVFQLSGGPLAGVAAAGHTALVEPLAGFEWDAAKAAINAAKHKVTFAFATKVFDDPSLATDDTFRRKMASFDTRPLAKSAASCTR
jgi:hypothetical protein